MKIALCTDNFFPATRGTENAVHNIALSLVTLGNEVCVFAPLKGYEKYGPFDYNKLPYRVERSHSLKVAFDEQINFPHLSPCFKRSLRDFSPDVVHAHTPFNIGNFCISYAKNNNIPSVLTIHTKFSYSYNLHVPFGNNNMLHKVIVKSLQKPIKKALMKADCVTVVSQSTIEEEISQYGVYKKIFVVRNGFPLKKDDNEQSNNISENVIRLCFAGGISREKNIRFILNTCRLLKERSIPYSLHLYGNGKDEKMYKSIASDLCIMPNVTFAGKKDREELMKLYEREDIFLFPSVFDNDSLAAIEARAKGVITLAIKNTGPSERIRDGIDGFCLDNSPVSFADKIQELYYMKTDKPNDFMALKNNAKNQKVHSWDEIAAQYLDIYKELLTNR